MTNALLEPLPPSAGATFFVAIVVVFAILVILQSHRPY